MPETVHTRSIRERIAWLNEPGSEHSRLYRSPEAYLNRARLIQSNMEAGRIPDDGFVLLASSPDNDIGVDQRRAVEKARFMSRFSAEIIAREVPFVHERMFRRTCVLNWNTRELTEIDVAKS